MPLQVTLSLTGDLNVFRLVAVTLLLGAAAGVLFQGKPGISDGFRMGCGVFLFALITVSIVSAVREIWLWLARYL